MKTQTMTRMKTRTIAQWLPVPAQPSRRFWFTARSAAGFCAIDRFVVPRRRVVPQCASTATQIYAVTAPVTDRLGASHLCALGRAGGARAALRDAERPAAGQHVEEALRGRALPFAAHRGPPGCAAAGAAAALRMPHACLPGFDGLPLHQYLLITHP